MATDYMAEIQRLEEQGGTNDEIAALVKARGAKISADPTLSQYAQSQAELEAKYASPVAQTSTTTNDDYIKQLQQLREQEALGALEKQYQSQFGALAQEEATIKPATQAAEQQAIIQRQREDKAFADYMATRGGGGVSAQQKIQSGTALGSSLAQLGRQEQAQLADIAQRRSTLQQAQAADIASTRAGLSANALEQAIAAQQLADERAYNESLTAKEIERQDVLNTLTAYSGDYQARINQLQNDNDPSNDWQIPYLQTLRQDKLATMNATPTLTSSSAALDLWKQVGVANKAISNALGIPVGTEYRTFSTGSGATTTAPTTTSNNAQFISNYNRLAQEIESAKAYGLTGSRVYDAIANQYDAFVAKYGKDVVDQFISDYQTSQQPQVQETPTVDAEAELNAAYQDMIRSSDPVAWLEQNKQYLTLNEYNQLVKLLPE